VKKGAIFTMEDVKRHGVIEALQKGKMTNREAAKDRAIGLARERHLILTLPISQKYLKKGKISI